MEINEWTQETVFKRFEGNNLGLFCEQNQWKDVGFESSSYEQSTSVYIPASLDFIGFLGAATANGNTGNLLLHKQGTSYFFINEDANKNIFCSRGQNLQTKSLLVFSSSVLAVLATVDR